MGDWRGFVRLAVVLLFGLTLGLAAAEEGLVGWWRFDDGWGDLAADSSAAGADGEICGGEWVKGAFGTALRLNGAGEHVAIPEIPDLDGAESMTLEAWVYWEETGRYPNIITLGRWCPGGVLVFVANNYCSFRLGRPKHDGWDSARDWQEASAGLLSKIELKRWYHLVATFDRPAMRTYVDGKLVGEGTWDFPIGCDGDGMIGKWGGQTSHQGLIDDVRIYARALSAEEVQTHYSAGKEGRSPSAETAYEVLPDRDASVPPALVLENRLARLTFDKNLRITGAIERASGRNVLARSSTWMSLKSANRNTRPSSFSFKDGILDVRFERVGGRVRTRVLTRDTYFVFEVLSVTGEDVEELTFLKLVAEPADIVHGMAGLAADGTHALCLRCLNLKARPTITGKLPLLKATCVPEHGLVGARAAFVVCSREELRPTLKEMARAEGVPYSKLGGPFALDAPQNRASYMFCGGLSETNVDEWIEMAQTAAIPFIHFAGWYQSQGHYEPRASLFPNGMAGLKATVARIHAAGLLAGMHTLTGCIQPRDPFASPTPDPRLSKDRTFTLTSDVGEADSEIPLDQTPRGLNVVWNYSSRGNVVQIDQELVQFRGLRADPPYALTNCTRGAWGSKAGAHPKGAEAHHLYVRYTAFQPDEHSTLVDDVAKCIADTVNECGFDLIYHDGAEGMPARHYGAARMRTAIFERITHPIRVESSWSGLHHGWWFHSCVGAWDHPLWGLKRCIDEHVKSNVPYEQRSLMPAQLGWWAIFGPKDTHDAEWPDEIEYLCVKSLGHDMSMSFQTLTPAANPWNARQGEYLRTIGRYEKLRLSGYFSGDVKTRLRTPRAEFRLLQAADGEWQFVPVDYLAQKVVASEDDRRRWTVTNRFALQPAALRIQALYSAAPYDDPGGMALAGFEEEDEFALKRTARGVKAEWTISQDMVKIGGSSACFTATNESAEPSSSWVQAGKVFAPDISLGVCKALGVWVHGDGKGEVINVQLRSPQLYHGAFDEHIITIDFVGWRYFELLLRERDSERHYDHDWPYGWAMSICRSPLDTRHVNAINIWYNNLPRGEKVQCYISPIKALPVVRTTLTNPRVSIGGQQLLFPMTIESGQYIELDADSACRLRNEAGAIIGEVTPTRETATFQLAPGNNELAFACDAESSPRPRVRVTLVPAGEPLGGLAKGKEHLKRKLRDLDDYSLTLGRVGDIEFLRCDKHAITRLDGQDNVWSLSNDSVASADLLKLRLQIGHETPGVEYEVAVPIEEFEEAAASDGQAPLAAFATGPRQNGLAKEGVTVSFRHHATGGHDGKECAMLRADSSLADMSGWAAGVRKFPAPRDFSGTRALGLWLKGDGKKAHLKVQLHDPDGRTADYYIRLDFSTWQYRELPKPALGKVDWSRIDALAFYLVGIPRKGSTTCRIDGIRGLRRIPKREVVNPSVTIGDTRIRFPITLIQGDTVTLDSSRTCRILGRDGSTKDVHVEGRLPSLKAGETKAQFACDGGLGNQVRIAITRK